MGSNEADVIAEFARTYIRVAGWAGWDLDALRALLEDVPEWPVFLEQVCAGQIDASWRWDAIQDCLYGFALLAGDAEAPIEAAASRE